MTVANIADQATLVQQQSVFKGGQDNPLLAPRGVILVAGKLIVADTGQNRVFIWNTLPQTEHQEPDVVLGQTQKTDTGRNAGGKTSASSLLYPSGMWSDGKRLIVADAWNHRVLIWHTFPTQDGQAADVVVGQKDFNGYEPNIEGVGSSPTAQTLYWPYGLYSDGQQLWIADTGNRRVLHYRTIPKQSYVAADGVIGKPNFTERDYDHEDPIWPYSVKVSANGAMAITDTQYYRVLIWQDWQTAFDQPADRIIGQASFSDNGQNQYGWFPQAHTLNWCYDSCFYRDGIWVADTGNSRVLWHPQIPSTNNAPAQALLGQDTFKVGIENKNHILSTKSSLYWPFHLCIEDQTMVIADTGNHRIIINQLNF